MLYAVLGFFLAPYLLQKTLTQILKNDFNAELRIDKIEINPFVLSLRIKGLALNNPQAQPTLKIQEVFSNFQLSSIFRLALTFDEIRFSKPEVFITRQQSGAFDFAYLTTSAKDQTLTDPSTEEDTDLLPLLIHQFTIEDFVVNWRDYVPAEPVTTRFGPIAIDIKELNTLANQSAQQTVKIATQDLGTLSWTGELQLNPLRSSAKASLEGAKFALISNYIRHQSGVEIVDGSANVELDYAIEQGEDGQINAKVENFKLSLVDIILNTFADGSGYDFSGDDQQILKLAKLELADGQLLWPEKILSLGSLSIDSPEIDALRDAGGVFNLEPKTTSTVVTNQQTTPSASTEPAKASSSASNKEDEWQWSVAEFSVNDGALRLIDRSLSPVASLGLSNFELRLTELSHITSARFPMSLSVQALSGGQISLNGAVQLLPAPAFDFELDVDALQLAAADPYLKQQTNLTLSSGELNLQGAIQGSALEPFAYQGSFEIANFVIAESVKEQRLASWTRFSTDKMALSLAQRKLDISLLQFNELYGDILIDKDGQLNLGQITKTGAEAAISSPEALVSQQTAETEGGKETQAPEFKVQIGGIMLSDASADFADLSLPLPFVVKIDSLNGKMTTISNQSIEPSEIALEGNVDEFGFASIGGTVTPLDPKQNTNIAVVFENIDVPTFSPYSIPFAGRKIASGSLDLKLGYQLQDSVLIGTNSVILRDFDFGEAVPHPDAMDIPLGLAVALLKDPSGKIAIDLPVSGNVDEPDFSYGGVVWTALGNLLTKVVLSPFTLLGDLLGIEASELENIKFLDGRTDLRPPEMQRAGKLVEALALRPELQLVIKGVFDPQADSLALKSVQLNANLALRISELSATSDPAILYAEHRRTVLEQMMIEQLGENLGPNKLAEFEGKFTTLKSIEGQAEPLSTFDRLAYVSALNQQLILMQELDSNALSELADSRASALQTALLAIEQSLQPRIVISDNISVTRAEDGPIEMPVSLVGTSK